jgi:hypothetical protein
MGEVPAGMHGAPGDQRQAVSLRSHLKIRPVVGRPDRVVVTSGEKSVC